jgi:signal peptidase II
MKGKQSYFIITFIALVADQVTKALATAWLEPHGSVNVIDGLFRLSYARNRGVAFSLFADSEFEVQWVLAAISATAAVGVAVYLGRSVASNRRLNLALSLLLAGIIGNLIDRVRLGEVVDFLDFHWGERFTWPTFNIADAVICIGAALLALELMREEKAEHLQPQTSSPASEESSAGSSE